MKYTRMQLVRLFTNLALLALPAGEPYLRGRLTIDRDYARNRADVVRRGMVFEEEL